MSTTVSWGSELDWTYQYRWRHNKSAKTHQINSNHITDFCGRSLPLNRMAKYQWWMDLIEEMRDGGRSSSSSTINRILSAGSTVINATRKAQRHDVKVPEFDRLKEGEHRIFWYTKEQLRQLNDVARNIFSRDDLADTIIFSALTGCRQGELMKLKPSDVDLEFNNIWIGGMSHLRTKGGECRAVPLATEILPIVKSRMDRTKLFGDDWNNKDQLYKQFLKVRRYCGIPETHVWHSLRDTFGTMVCEHHHPKQAQDLLGHKTIEMTMKYCHASDSANRLAVSSLHIGLGALDQGNPESNSSNG